jgi:mannose-6-phosphate isomerase-like protein (cupin superfamily)
MTTTPAQTGARLFSVQADAVGSDAEERMVAVIDFKAEFGRLKMLEGRTPTSSEAECEGAFARLAPYRDGAISAGKFAGTSAWERHPVGDEIVQIFDGATTLHLMTGEGKQSLALSAGMIAVVPQNTWHQFEAPDGGRRRCCRKVQAMQVISACRCKGSSICLLNRR